MDKMPSPFPPPTPSFQPPQTGNWWQRNWKWFVPTGCLSLFLLVAAFAFGIAMVIMTAVKSSDAYKNSLQRATTNEQVIRALGSPITTGMFVSGNINVSGTSGHADLSFPLSGPKNSGTLYLDATKSEGVWTYSKLDVHVDKTGEIIDLRQPTP